MQQTQPSVRELTAWLDVGQALRVQPFVDALLADDTADAGLVAVRALRQLGAERASDALALRLSRRHRHHAEAQLAGLRAIMGCRGLHAAWRAFQRNPLAAAAGDSERAGRLSLEGFWLSRLRDEGPALARHAEALALAGDEAWLWVEYSYTLAHIDRTDEALAAARRALDLCPGYRTALLHAAHLLQLQQRADEAAALLTDPLEATGNAMFAWLLHGLADDGRRPAEALSLLDRTEQGLPRAERHWRGVLAARRADALLALGRYDEARAQAELVPGTGFYGRLAERLAGAPASAHRVLIPLAMVKQHWMTCAPATLTALAGHWGRPADHVEVAQAICYDGTPQASERQWAESQGFVVRECRLDWDTSCALIDAGVPFALATQQVGSGHLQAVVGVDRLRQTLLVRDPSQPLHVEYEAQPLFGAQQSNGPRALVMLPPDERWRLQDLHLPQVASYDIGHKVLAALQRHDRRSAAAALEELKTGDPEGDNTLRAQRHVALYDADEPRILAATEALLERYPEDRNLQLSRLSSLYEVRGQKAAEAWLAELAGRPHSDALLLARWANQLMLDARRAPSALQVLRRALRLDSACARAWAELGDVLWVTEGVAASLAPLRWASTLQPTDEAAAARYARACRIAGRTDEGITWLRERDRVWGDRSGRPAVTLAEELESQQRSGEAAEALAAAVQRRPNDNTLRLEMAERALMAQRLDDARQWMDACTDTHAPSLLRLRALLHEARGEFEPALTAVREAVTLEPLNLSHHRLLLRLLRRRHGDADALAQWRPVVDAHPAHFELQRLLYEALPDVPEALNAQLERLHAQHPGVPWLQRERALQASRQGRHDEAVLLAETAVALAPAAAVSHDVRAYCVQRRDGWDAALPHMHAALQRDAECESAVLRLLGAPDGERRREGTNHLAAELRRQVLLGDGLLQFQEHAAPSWTGDAVLALLHELRERWPALWQGPVAEARQLSRLSRAEEALTMLDEAAERFPALPRVHLERAQTLRHAGRIDDAIHANARAIALSPGWNLALRLQVDLLCEHRREFAAAQALLERALQMRDAWADADLAGLLGWVLEQQRKDPEALEAARRSLRLDPAPGWVWAIARRVCDRAEDPARFDALVEDIVLSRPGDAEAWRVRAQQDRDDVQALAAAERAIELQPRHEAAWLARFERLQRLGRSDEIEKWLQQLPWPAPAPVSLRVWSSRLAWSANRRPEAIAQLRALHEEVPQDEELCRQLADWYDEQNLHPAYLEQAEALVALAPTAARSHGYLGHALIKNSRVPEAIAPLQRALELFPGYSFAARQLVAASREAGRPEVAEPALQALWPHAHDIATACDGIELAAAARRQDLAHVWLDRLGSIDDEFDIERTKAALAAWRAAGWKAELAAWQRAHLERGGGPAGIGADWLVRAERFGSWPAFVTALWRQRRAERPHLLVALLRWLGDRGASLRLLIVTQLYASALRRHALTWAEVSYALARLNMHRAVVRWLQDWPARDKPPSYAMANLANALAVLRRWDRLEHVVQHTLARLPYQEDMRLWQLLLLARADRIDELEQALHRDHEWAPDPWMRSPLQALRAFVALARERGSPTTWAALRRHGGDGVAQGEALCRELRRLAMARHTPWVRLPRAVLS